MRSILMFVLVCIFIALSASLPLDAVTKAPVNMETQLERPEVVHNSVEELDEATEDVEETPDNDGEDEGLPESDAEDDEEDDEVIELGDTNAECKPLMCSRLYQPICASVDGVKMTAPNDCHLKSKMHCAKKTARSLGEKVPVFRILHEGPCSGKEP